jgi:hypothetical protein
MKDCLSNKTATYPAQNASRRFWSGLKTLVRWSLGSLDGTIALSPISWIIQDLGIVARFALLTLPRYAVLQL